MSSCSPPSESLSALLEQVGPALSRLRRRTAGGRWDLTRNLVLNLVADSLGEMTISGIATEMRVTRPVASRTIAACIVDGLLRHADSPSNGRRTVLELTDAGDRELRRYASEQRETFERITATWEPAERLQFAQFLIRYSQGTGTRPSMTHHHDGAYASATVAHGTESPTRTAYGSVLTSAREEAPLPSPRP
ncbi:MarR family winged helix-turn-helix transcriptional regulator [Amycolatopsis speibonae]|uniref:MarR family winged helix-turn-helix transcriptional regulator n=1 Tax=Amycolatopsis speibonae TaxID=1450224 RepID=A0ABV7P0U5_9PSEU